jgi:DNA-binding NarL/FixJ family response regulator
VASLLICDDAVAFAALLQHWLRDADDIDVVGVARTADAAVAEATRTSPDIVILDHRLGPETSERVVPRLRAACPGAVVLLISGMRDPDLARVSRAAGADAYLSKAVSRSRLVAVVRELAGP